MLTFVFDAAETPAERVGRIAREAVSEGTMGCWLRRDRYTSFLDIWNMSEDYSYLIDSLHAGKVLGGVKTSCAVDASAVLGYAGRKLHKPWHADGTWGITSWLGLGFGDESWVDAVDRKTGVRREPEVGFVFYRGGKTASNGHVGVFGLKLENGLWRTVEGGGNLRGDEGKGLTTAQQAATNGTVMRMTPEEGKDFWALDSSGRHPTGWWDTNRIGLPTGDDVLRGLAK